MSERFPLLSRFLRRRTNTPGTPEAPGTPENEHTSTLQSVLTLADGIQKKSENKAYSYTAFSENVRLGVDDLLGHFGIDPIRIKMWRESGNLVMPESLRPSVSVLTLDVTPSLTDPQLVSEYDFMMGTNGRFTHAMDTIKQAEVSGEKDVPAGTFQKKIDDLRKKIAEYRFAMPLVYTDGVRLGIENGQCFILDQRGVERVWGRYQNALSLLDVYRNIREYMEFRRRYPDYHDFYSPNLSEVGLRDSYIPAAFYCTKWIRAIGMSMQSIYDMLGLKHAFMFSHVRSIGDGDQIFSHYDRQAPSDKDIALTNVLMRVASLLPHSKDQLYKDGTNVYLFPGEADRKQALVDEIVQSPDWEKAVGYYRDLARLMGEKPTVTQEMEFDWQHGEKHIKRIFEEREWKPLEPPDLLELVRVLTTIPTKTESTVVLPKDTTSGVFGVPAEISVEGKKYTVSVGLKEVPLWREKKSMNKNSQTTTGIEVIPMNEMEEYLNHTLPHYRRIPGLTLKEIERLPLFIT